MRDWLARPGSKHKRPMKPRVMVFAIHPAPYQDSTFCEVARRDNVDIYVNYLFERNCDQRYLEEGVVFQYTAQVLSEGHQLQDRSKHDLKTVDRLICQHKPDVVFVAGYVHGTTRRALLHCMIRRIPVVMVADSERNSEQRYWKTLGKRAAIPMLAATLSAVWVPGRAGLVAESKDDRAACHISSEPWDLIYIDWNHDYEAALSDYKLSRDNLKSGGLLVMDDSSLGTSFHPPRFAFSGHPGPSRVVKEQANTELIPLGSVGHNNVFQKQ
jgi:Methyltransferase domain